jgi:hypothetical protein
MAWAPDYATTADLAAFVRIPDSDDDAQLALAATAASRAVDRATNRQFGKVDTAEERLYVPRPDYERGLWVVDVDDFQTVSNLSVEVDGTAVTVFVKEPYNADKLGRPWTRLAFTADSEAKPSCAPHEVAVTAVWGWTAVPTAVKEATLLQASRFFVRRNAPFGIAGSPDTGSEMRLLARVDPDVAVALGDYKRQRSPF